MSKQNGILDVRRQLPQIGGMGLLYVYDVERHAILIGLIQPIELGNLPAEWRSSIAAEDQDYRPFPPLLR